MSGNLSKIESIIRDYRYRIPTIPDSFFMGIQITEKKLKNARKTFASGIESPSVIAFYDTTITRSGKSGFIFTDTKIYFVEMFEKPQKLWYDDIKSVDVAKMKGKSDADNHLLITRYNEPTLRITDGLLNKTPLCEMLRKICDVIRPQKNLQSAVNISYTEVNGFGAVAGGRATANYQQVNKLYNESKFNAAQGHGFAAECANDLHDKIRFQDAKVVGNDNAKNGPDRLVNDVFIQSKYCQTGKDCIRACFDQNGEFRYWNADNTPMQIEVPKDKYDEALREMQEKIRRGEVKGVQNPDDAEKIVRKGNVTYEQAKNIAKAGNIDSLKYDATNGAVISLSAFGVTAMVTLATNLWNGEDFSISVKNAAWSGLKVGGTAFVTTVVASQLSRAGLNSALVGSSEAFVGVLGPKASAVLINAFRSGSNIYGAAAMKSAAKLLRGNTITMGVTIIVLSSVDVANIFRGRISGKQLFKNMVNTASTVAGGTGGWLGGAALGSAVLPGIGTIVGGLAGSVVAGSAAGGVSNKITHKFIEDDAEQMVAIIQKQFEILAVDYLLNQKEAEKVADHLSEELKGSRLREMYASDNRPDFAVRILRPLIEKEIRKRVTVKDVRTEDMVWGFKSVLEEIADRQMVPAGV